VHEVALACGTLTRGVNTTWKVVAKNSGMDEDKAGRLEKWR
jgi:hypothetical protein